MKFRISSWPTAYSYGLFVNGRRVLLRGINRHSFWPDSGRTLNDEINRRDVELHRVQTPPPHLRFGLRAIKMVQ